MQFWGADCISDRGAKLSYRHRKRARKQKKGLSSPLLLSAAVITRNSAAGCSQLHLTGGSQQQRLCLVHFKAPFCCRSSSELQFPPQRQPNCSHRPRRQRWTTQQVLFSPSPLPYWVDMPQPQQHRFWLRSFELFSEQLCSLAQLNGLFSSQTAAKTLPVSVFEIWLVLTLCCRRRLQIFIN